ncbi:hypothetical protein GF407_17675 [candidate division KSB1 bacterium]|nr:hypothetical protein [candidate division KSB1 bacterium]
MKKLFTLCMAMLLVIAFTASASVDLELSGGMEVVLEWDDAMGSNPSNPDNPNDKYPVFIELSGDLVETDGYVWGKIISDERTSHSGFAGWAPQTNIAEATTVMRFTSPSTDPHGYGSGNAEGRRYYQVNYSGGSNITRDLMVAFHATNDGVSSDPVHVWMDDGTDETWYQPGGSTSPVSATSATVPSGASFWFFGPAEIARVFAQMCLKGAAHVPISVNPYLDETRSSGDVMHAHYRLFFGQMGIEAMPATSPFGDGKSISLSPIPDHFVDWVYVYVRDGSPTGNATTLAEGSAIITKSGDIVDVNGSSGMPIENVPTTQDVHLVIRHKSHLAAITVQIQLGNYDSTTPLDLMNVKTNFAAPLGDDGVTTEKVTLAGTVAPQEVYAILTGDGDFAQSMNFLDSFDSEYTLQRSGLMGYYRADYDLTGFVDSFDDTWTKKGSGRFTFITTDDNLPGDNPLP